MECIERQNASACLPLRMYNLGFSGMGVGVGWVNRVAAATQGR